MKMKNLRVYGGMLAMIAAMAVTPLNVHAEDEVLTEVTEETEVTYEDVTEETTEETTTETTTEETTTTTEDTDGNEDEFDPFNTDIEEEDESYDTDREKVEDASTEWERKIHDNTPDNPTPDNPTPDNPTPSNPTPSNPTPSNPTPSNPVPVPKTGFSLKTILALGAAIGAIGAGRVILKSENELEDLGTKVVSSRKKYKKNSKGLK